MQTRFSRALLVVVAGVAAYGGTVLATPPSGVTSTLFAVGQFDEIKAKTLSSDWQVRINTKGESDLHVLENRIVPGGSFGPYMPFIAVAGGPANGLSVFNLLVEQQH